MPGKASVHLEHQRGHRPDASLQSCRTYREMAQPIGSMVGILLMEDVAFTPSCMR